MTDATQHTLQLLSYIVNYLFPKRSNWFVSYMVWSFYRIRKRRAGFTLQVLNKKVFQEILSTSNDYKLFDLNTTVILNSAFVFKGERFIKLLVSNGEPCFDRVALVAPSNLCHPASMLVSDIFMHNITKSIKPEKLTVNSIRESSIDFATDLEVSFIPCPSFDLNFISVHTILKNYLSVPRLLCMHDVIEICLSSHGKELFFNTGDGSKVTTIDQSIYIKCCKLKVKDETVERSCLCLFSKTTTRESMNTASFLPAISDSSWAINRCRDSCVHLENFPLAMRNYFNYMKCAVEPFIASTKLPVNPIFLIEGVRGDGKESLLQELAANTGLNYYKVDNMDLTANIYAQNETKLANIFLAAKLTAPCLLAIHNFENFGKNNEGEYDERIIGFFENEIDSLFANNTFPIVLFCCSNGKDIPACLKRLFLEIFKVNAPDEKERENIIHWFLKSNKFDYKFDVSALASQTNGLLVEDLKALLQDAYVRKLKTIKSFKDDIILHEEDIEKSLDGMHSTYNESLGAPKVPKVQWTDIGGLTEVKEEIIKTINLPLKHPNLMKLTGLKRSGILLFGPPGTGKTLLAKAIATECGLCFLSVKGPELLNKYVGQSEQNVRQVFEKARQASPCIIFFDELDSLAPNRGRSGDSGGVMDRVVSQLLAEMDGLNEAKTIFTIGATNRPDLIDPALLRPGRFDKLLYVGPCTDAPSKVSVLKALIQKLNLADDVDLKEIVNITPNNITGADFYGICANAWSSAVRRLVSKIELDSADPNSVNQNDVIVDMNDFKYALLNTKPSISEKDLLYFEKLRCELSSNI